MNSKRILIAWFRFSVNGAIGRFLNLARVLRGRGHVVEFVSLSGELETDWEDFPGQVQSFEQAASQSFDAVFLPGSGARPRQVKLLKRLCDERFGQRFQFVLNDTSRKERFQRFNELFRPHDVVFNNSHWQPRDFRMFLGRAFVFVPGAVDIQRFRPASEPAGSRPFVRIGGFSRKNVEPLLDALERLPDDHTLELYGEILEDSAGRIRKFEQTGCLKHHGLLFGDELVRFYQSLDLFVITEVHAGWCNPAAEAFACGLPVICSRAGTIDFAEHERNCLILDELTGEQVAAAVTRLVGDTKLSRRLAAQAREDISRFTWERSADQLLELVEFPPPKSYYQLPEAGLFGKWRPEERMLGLEPILENCRGSSVLDLGTAEGAISYTLAKRGAERIHAFELDPIRVKGAARALGSFGNDQFQVRQGDLSDLPAFLKEHRALLLQKYDVVLFLGVYHHLPEATRDRVLELALERAGRFLAVRACLDWLPSLQMRFKIRRAGFRLVTRRPAERATRTGWLAVFERRSR